MTGPRTPVIGYREVILYGKKEKNAVIKINGDIQKNEDGIIYRLHSPSSFHGWWDIEIEGLVEIFPDNCYYNYPLLDGNILEIYSGLQYEMCKWMYPENFGIHAGIKYKHLILNGPSYIEKTGERLRSIYEYETDLKIKKFDYAYNMQYIYKELHNDME
jgi:hypothetical protein